MPGQKGNHVLCGWASRAANTGSKPKRISSNSHFVCTSGHTLAKQLSSTARLPSLSRDFLDGVRRPRERTGSLRCTATDRTIAYRGSGDCNQRAFSCVPNSVTTALSRSKINRDR